jgi:hypothetical protein
MCPNKLNFPPGGDSKNLPGIIWQLFQQCTLLMKTVSANFKFKGDRNYIHGTDMYNHTMEQLLKTHKLNTSNRVRLSIHSIASKQCQLILGEPGESFSKPSNLIADLVVETPEENIAAMVVEADQPVTERYPYDEAKIESLCKIIDQQIEIKENSGYTPIEVAVAMNKQLHNHLLPHKDGKWFFTRIDLDRPFKKEHSQNLTIILKHNFNDRLTKSELLFRGESIGNIFFSLVSQ